MPTSDQGSILIRWMSLDSVRRRIRSEPDAIQTRYQYQSGRAPESVNHALIFREISTARHPRDPVYDVFVARKKAGAHRCQTQMTVASNEVLWERVLSLLVVGACVLGGSTVLLVQALPPLLHGFP